jgi:hypothetical protein
MSRIISSVQVWLAAVAVQHSHIIGLTQPFLAVFHQECDKGSLVSFEFNVFAMLKGRGEVIRLCRFHNYGRCKHI